MITMGLKSVCNLESRYSHSHDTIHLFIDLAFCVLEIRQPVFKGRVCSYHQVGVVGEMKLPHDDMVSNYTF